ncbi:aminotransferase [Pyrobaculum sp. 3827-6]|uniref:aminotransferase n=1 Tax=Pyrobaculum sp. 3827-6 TaxID=2983604 RepID=UPI0021DACC9C|nr:aminotransferase [Pyrobaculum sp. 3827-6]MCU7787989.1 aminotransferase [Pyrobaculum sp. 3827-6]
MVDLSGTWIKNSDVDVVRLVHETVVREFGRRALQYTDTAGAPEPREELRRILAAKGFTRHEVYFTTSIADSIRVVAEIHLNPGECIQPEDPTQKEVLSYAKCGRPKAVYIQPHWRNPDGYIYTAGELEAAARSAPLAIYDLTYGLLAGDVPYVPEGAVVVGSLDVLFPSLHLAYVAVPPSLSDYYLNVLEASYLHPPTYMQYLFYAAVKSGAVYAVFNSLARRRDLVRQHLGVEATPYFAWLRPRDKTIFLKHGALDGSVFSWRGRFGEYVRLGLTSATEEELADFLSKVPL